MNRAEYESVGVAVRSNHGEGGEVGKVRIIPIDYKLYYNRQH